MGGEGLLFPNKNICAKIQAWPFIYFLSAFPLPDPFHHQLPIRFVKDYQKVTFIPHLPASP